MTTSVIIALLLFVPATAGAFAWLEPRRAMLASLLGGWLFLPHFDAFGRAVPLLHSKAAFVPAIVAAMSWAFAPGPWARLRLRPLDAAVAAVCVLPFLASRANGLGAYDGLVESFRTTATWGLPYALGRALLDRPSALRDAGDAMVVAALAYVPLCLLEIRISPQLHRIVYGYHQHSFLQHMRAGSYRPMVFMQHGLMVALFMAAASLVAYWSWRTRARPALAGVPMAWVFVTLAATTAACRSAGALALLLAGAAVLEGTRWLRTPALVLALVALPAAYCGARLEGWSGSGLVHAAGAWLTPQRAASLAFRIETEDVLIARAVQRPWLGWGGWGRWRDTEEAGRDVLATDGMWAIELGTKGGLGLGALLLALALPVLALLRRFPARHWGDPRLASAAAAAVALSMWAVDDLFNAMMTPIFPLLGGALASASLALPVAVGAARRAAGPHRSRWPRAPGGAPPEPCSPIEAGAQRGLGGALPGPPRLP